MGVQKVDKYIPDGANQILADQVLMKICLINYSGLLLNLTSKFATGLGETVAYDKLIDSTNNSVEDQRKDLKKLPG